MANWETILMLLHVQLIQVIANPPIKQPPAPRHIPFALHKKVEHAQLVDDMIQKKVVHSSKNPWPWASPVVLAAKKSGET